jgi:hypothetical protein
MKRISLAVLLPIAIVQASAGCASTPSMPRMETRSISKRLAVPNCRVSVPLSQSEVLSLVKRWDHHPNPQMEPEWIVIAANQQPGDELRMVSCRVGDPYFYALVRNDTILLKFHPSIVD